MVTKKIKPKDHDAYIDDAAQFAKPILERLRKIIHKSCPVAEETMKWSSPCFEHHGLMVSMAAFKAHVNLVFFRGKELEDPDDLFDGKARETLEIIRLESVSDVPAERILKKYLVAAAKLNEAKAEDGKPARKKATKAKPGGKSKQVIPVPKDLLAALSKQVAAKKTFDAFSPSAQKEYVEWIEEAKRPATRQKRIDQAIEWMAEGKPRNWKYMKNGKW